MEIQNIIDLMTTIITSENDSGETFYDSNLKRILDLNTSDNFNECKNQSLRFSHVKKTIELLSCLKECLLKHSDDSTDIILSAIHCATVSRCIHSVVTHGFIPCLIPSIWKSFENNQKYEQTIKTISPDTCQGTREAILGLRVLIEKQIDRNKITYLAFIDLEKAFDKVNWNKMLHILREIGIEQQDLRIIHLVK